MTLASEYNKAWTTLETEYNDAMKNSPPSHLVSTAWMSGPLAAPSLALMLASCSRILTCSSLAATWARCWARHLLSSSLQRWRAQLTAQFRAQ